MPAPSCSEPGGRSVHTTRLPRKLAAPVRTVALTGVHPHGGRAPPYPTWRESWTWEAPAAPAGSRPVMASSSETAATTARAFVCQIRGLPRADAIPDRCGRHIDANALTTSLCPVWQGHGLAVPRRLPVSRHGHGWRKVEPSAPHPSASDSGSPATPGGHGPGRTGARRGDGHAGLAVWGPAPPDAAR